MSTDTVIEKKKVTVKKLQEPGRFKVIVCNDDVTPIDFVILMLITVFNYSEKDALELTLDVHNRGSAVAGVYSYEIAEQKGIDGTNMARSHGYPLIIKVEAE